MARPLVKIAVAAGVACITQAASAQLSVPWYTIDGGGGTSSGGSYTISGTIGQPDAGAPMSGGPYSVIGGFWAGVTSTPTCRLDYNQDGSLNPDDIGDYITDYFTFPQVPGPGGYAIPCPDNPPPYDQGYKAGYTPDGSGQCGEPNPDNLGDWITDYFIGCAGF